MCDLVVLEAILVQDFMDIIVCGWIWRIVVLALALLVFDDIVRHVGRAARQLSTRKPTIRSVSEMEMAEWNVQDRDGGWGVDFNILQLLTCCVMVL